MMIMMTRNHNLKVVLFARITHGADHAAHHCGSISICAPFNEFEIRTLGPLHNHKSTLFFGRRKMSSPIPADFGCDPWNNSRVSTSQLCSNSTWRSCRIGSRTVFVYHPFTSVARIQCAVVNLEYFSPLDKYVQIQGLISSGFA